MNSKNTIFLALIISLFPFAGILVEDCRTDADHLLNTQLNHNIFLAMEAIMVKDLHAADNKSLNKAIGVIFNAEPAAFEVIPTYRRLCDTDPAMPGVIRFLKSNTGQAILEIEATYYQRDYRSGLSRKILMQDPHYDLLKRIAKSLRKASYLWTYEFVRHLQKLKVFENKKKWRKLKKAPQRSELAEILKDFQGQEPADIEKLAQKYGHLNYDQLKEFSDFLESPSGKMLSEMFEKIIPATISNNYRYYYTLELKYR